MNRIELNARLEMLQSDPSIKDAAKKIRATLRRIESLAVCGVCGDEDEDTSFDEVAGMNVCLSCGVEAGEAAEMACIEDPSLDYDTVYKAELCRVDHATLYALQYDR